MDDSERRIVDGTSWAEFCDSLKRAGNVVLDECVPMDPFLRAEGYRYLTRLLRGAFESFVEDGDPQAPELQRVAHETVKMGADNPDNHYLSAPVSGKYTYRIRGKRGTVHYLGFGTQEGSYGATGSLDTVGYLDDAQLKLEPDGSFEIALSVEPQPGNWLRMSPKTRTLVVRQSFLDKSKETRADLVIERTDGPHQPRPVSAQTMDRTLISSAKFVEGCSKLFLDWTAGFRARPNELPRFDPGVAERAGGVPNIAYYHGYWQLGPDEALVIEVTPPPCDYWNFQLNNFWMESLDYRYFQISVNNGTAKLEPDGSVRVIVAHEDPGKGNWIDTCGHELGTMCWRWVRATEQPAPQTRVVRWDEL